MPCTTRRLTQPVSSCLATTTLALAGCFFALSAKAGTGDLDPSFADHGRLSPIPDVLGAARSVELLTPDGFLVGGGYARALRRSIDIPRTPCQVFAQSFVRKLGEDGAVDAAYAGATIDRADVSDFARQADGSVVAVGRVVVPGASPLQCMIPSDLVVHRLGQDGSLDTGFGADGLFRWDNGSFTRATSLVLDPDGRIVVAGVSDGAVVVLRLTASGELDGTFGVAGVYVVPDVTDSGQVRIGRTEAGGYRVSAEVADGCAIAGLTPDGALDAEFGDSGIAAVTSHEGLAASCESMAVLPDDRLLVAGSTQERAFAARLLANGGNDPSFAADAMVADTMFLATSIQAGGGGTVLVAGVGENGTSLMRMLDSGRRDTRFGDDGRTWIELSSDYASVPIVHDIAVRTDGSVTAVGSDGSYLPFAARLIGESNTAGPGVVGLQNGQVSVSESDGRAVLRVRRRGGSDGAVSVRYRTVETSSAMPDRDFRPASGALQWADGDTSEREIMVEIVADDGPAEGYESFQVELHGAQGAGIGLRLGNVDIQPDGSPSGQITISGSPSIVEEPGVAAFILTREYYYGGQVCVTLTPQSQTATAGNDFDAGTHAVCWEDQDAEDKRVEVEILDDSAAENQEMFSVVLSNPTGSAILGWLSSVDVPIAANDQSAAPPPDDDNSGGGGSGGGDSGGGGPAGLAELLALLILSLTQRRACRAARWTPVTS